MFVEDNTHPSVRSSQNSKQGEFQSALNINYFPHGGLQVKVVLMNPNGNVTPSENRLRGEEVQKKKEIVK